MSPETDRPKPRRSDFGNKVAQTFGAEALLFVLGMLTAIVTARLLGPSGKGEFALVTVVAGLTYSMGQLGVPQAVVYFRRHVRESELAANALWLSAVLGVAWLTVGGTAISLGAADVLELDKPLMLLTMLGVPLLFVEAGARALIQGKYQMTRFNLLRIVNPAVFLVLLGLGLFMPDRVEAAVIAWLGAELVSTTAAVWLAVRGTPMEGASWRPSWARWKGFLGFGARTHVGNFLKYFQYRFDVVLVGALLSKRDVGLYAVAVALAELPWRFPDAVGLVLFPKLAATSDPERVRDMTPRVTRHVMFMTFVSSCVLILVAPWCIDVMFGSSFAGAAGPARILLLGGVALSLWKMLAHDLVARGRPNGFSFSALCSLIAMVVGCLLLIPWLGLPGGALASALAYFIASAVLFTAYHRLTGNRLRDCVVMRREDFAFYRGLLQRSSKAPETTAKGERRP